jgi:hypothetical protein
MGSISRTTGFAFTWIAASGAMRIFYLAYFCPFDLATDEAHYWDWSRQLDWCYYSKGPLVAWLIRLSCGCFGETMLAVRFPAIISGCLLLLGLYTLTASVYRSARLGLTVIAMALTLPIVAAGSTLMTIDAPFTCAWMGALVCVHQASLRGARWAWIAAGACIGIGVLAKHTMVLFVPSFALFLAFSPTHRHQLREPGFWIMTALGALGGVPILVWNAINDWPTFRHTQMHAGVDQSLTMIGPLKYLAGQCALLLGFWFIAWGRGMWAHRPSVEQRPDQQFLWWMSLPTFVFFGLFAFKNNGGEPNWPIAGYLSGAVLAAGWLRQQWQRVSVRIGTIGFAAFGLLLTLAFHAPHALQPVLLCLTGPATTEHPMPLRRVDPTARLRGWRHLAAEVDRVRTEVSDPILATERWTQAGELAFYCEGHPKLYCMGLFLGDRDSQYDLWRPNPVRDPADFHGRTFILVGSELDRLSHLFGSMETPRVVQYRESGQLIAEWTITVAHDYRGGTHGNSAILMVYSP